MCNNKITNSERFYHDIIESQFKKSVYVLNEKGDIPTTTTKAVKVIFY